MEEFEGLVHLYHGDGKGKTTAAMGLALRFSHCEKRVLVVQFLKSGTSGEILQLSSFDNVTVLAGNTVNKFSWEMNEAEKLEVKRVNDGYLEQVLASDCDFFVLDELCGAISSGMISEELVKQLLKDRKKHQEMVITGRNPPEYLVEAANYITNMKMERHPFETDGVRARKGIEF